jgi:hypothetical protein
MQFLFLVSQFVKIFSSETASSGFQRRRFLEIDQPETTIACGGHVC